jgi:membrane dipeptidase
LYDRIEIARAAARATLKISKRDLEHGLALHKSSIVVDAYGFTPRMEIDVKHLDSLIREGVTDDYLDDVKEAMMLTGWTQTAALRQEFQDAWHASGVTCVIQNAGVESHSVTRLLRRTAHYTYLTDCMAPFLTRASTPAAIHEAKSAEHHTLYFCTNGVPLTEVWRNVEEELSFIELFFRLGCRMMHLTYNRRNLIGDGCAEPSNAGLSDFGRATIRELNRAGIIVDVAHAGQRSSFEAARVSSLPIVASHTGASSLHSHCRNKSDEVLRAIAESDGVIGVYAMGDFLGLSRDLNAMLDHIEYIAKLIGVDHVAIGTDLAYESENFHRNFSLLPASPRGKAYEQFWPAPPAGAAVSSTPDNTLVWTNWPLLSAGLVQRGFSDSDIQKLIGLNFLRVADAVMSRSRPEMTKEACQNVRGLNIRNPNT